MKKITDVPVKYRVAEGLRRVKVAIERDVIVRDLSRAVSILRDCQKAEDAKKLIDVGVAARVWAERQKLGQEAKDSAVEFVLRAERRLGELLAETDMNPGGRPKKPVEVDRQVSGGSADTPLRVFVEVGPPSLEQLGVSRDLSSRAQKIAAIPEKQFESAFTEARKSGREISRATIQRLMPRPPPDLSRGIVRIVRSGTYYKGGNPNAESVTIPAPQKTVPAFDQSDSNHKVKAEARDVTPWLLADAIKRIGAAIDAEMARAPDVKERYRLAIEIRRLGFKLMEQHRPKKKALLTADQAKEMLVEVGDDFETEARRLLKDNFAGIHQLKTMSDFSRASLILMKAVIAKEITPQEANAADKVVRKRLRELERTWLLNPSLAGFRRK